LNEKDIKPKGFLEYIEETKSNEKEFIKEEETKPKGFLEYIEETKNSDEYLTMKNDETKPKGFLEYIENKQDGHEEPKAKGFLEFVEDEEFSNKLFDMITDENKTKKSNKFLDFSELKKLIKKKNRQTDNNDSHTNLTEKSLSSKSRERGEGSESGTNTTMEEISENTGEITNNEPEISLVEYNFEYIIAKEYETLKEFSKLEKTEQNFVFYEEYNNFKKEKSSVKKKEIFLIAFKSIPGIEMNENIKKLVTNYLQKGEMNKFFDILEKPVRSNILGIYKRLLISEFWMNFKNPDFEKEKKEDQNLERKRDEKIIIKVEKKHSKKKKLNDVIEETHHSDDSFSNETSKSDLIYEKAAYKQYFTDCKLNEKVLESTLSKDDINDIFLFLILFNDIENIQLIFDKNMGIELNHVLLDQEDTSYLHISSKLNFFKISDLLIKKGFNVNSEDKFHRTPLLIAASYGHRETLLLLLSKGADINARDIYGTSPIHILILKDNYELINDLLDFNVDINLKRHDGF
jgi:hypothetical protein